MNKNNIGGDMENILMKAEQEYNMLSSTGDQERMLKDPFISCLLKNVEREIEYIFKYAPKEEDEDGYVHMEVPCFEGHVRTNPFLNTIYGLIRSDKVLETEVWDCNRDPRINIFAAFQNSYESMYKTFIPRYHIDEDVLKVVYKRR
jgi:hypothetical protein